MTTHTPGRAPGLALVAAATAVTAAAVTATAVTAAEGIHGARESKADKEGERAGALTNDAILNEMIERLFTRSRHEPNSYSFRGSGFLPV